MIADHVEVCVRITSGQRATSQGMGCESHRAKAEASASVFGRLCAAPDAQRGLHAVIQPPKNDVQTHPRSPKVKRMPHLGLVMAGWERWVPVGAELGGSTMGWD